MWEKGVGHLLFALSLCNLPLSLVFSVALLTSAKVLFPSRNDLKMFCGMPRTSLSTHWTCRCINCCWCFWNCQCHFQEAGAGDLEASIPVVKSCYSHRCFYLTYYTCEVYFSKPEEHLMIFCQLRLQERFCILFFFLDFPHLASWWGLRLRN